MYRTGRPDYSPEAYAGPGADETSVSLLLQFESIPVIVPLSPLMVGCVKAHEASSSSHTTPFLQEVQLNLRGC
jgi:hypothetical protein